MPVTIDEVETRVEERPPVAEAAPDMKRPRPAVDPGELIKAYALIQERQLRLVAD